MARPLGDDETVPASPESMPADPDAPMLPVGAKLGTRYKVLGFLGKGGMGSVYLASDSALDDKKVALKLVSRQLGEDGVDRLRREVLLAQQVTHENVCRIYDLEELDHERWMIKMEYIAGATLAAKLQRGPLGIAEALATAKQIGDGIGAAHARGVIHRDLKPGNVIIEQTGRVVLMDFGIARLDTISGDTEPEVSGTPAYMAPEQVNAERSDARTDVYAFGCLLYHALVGHVPFEAPTSMAMGLRHVRDPAPDPRAERPEIPEWLARAVMTMMEKAPAKRPQTILEAQRLLVPPAPARNRKARWIFAGVAGVLVAGAVATYALTRRDPPWAAAFQFLPAFDNESSAGLYISPDGKRLAYASDREVQGRYRIHIANMDGSDDRAVSPGTRSLKLTGWADDHTLLVKEGYDSFVLPASGGEPTKLAPAATAAPCGEGLLMIGRAPDCWTCTRLVLRAKDGTERVVVSYSGRTLIINPKCDREGKRAILSYYDGANSMFVPADLRLVDLATGESKDLTNDHKRNLEPVFTPDGKSIVYTAARGDRLNLFEMDLASGATRQLTSGEGPDLGATISPDGRTLAFHVAVTSGPLFARSATETRRISPGRPLMRWLSVTPDDKTLISVDVSTSPHRVVATDIATGAARTLGLGGHVTLTPDGAEVISTPEVAPYTVSAMRLDGTDRRTLGEFPGRVIRLAAGPDGQVHAMLEHKGELESWRIPLAGGAPVRDAPAPWLLVAPAPTGELALWLRRTPDADYRITIGRAHEPPPEGAPGVNVTTGFAYGFDRSGTTMVLYDGAQLLRIDLATGSSAHVARISDVYGATLSPDGAIIYTSEIESRVRRALITNFGDRPRP